MAKSEKLDVLDRKILQMLSKSARKPFKDVAEACSVSRAAIHQRVQKMIDEETILGSMFLVNPKAVGYLTCTYVGIQLEKGSLCDIVSSKLAEIPEIVECHFTTGPYALLVKLYARDNEHLLELLNGKIAQIDGVTSTETLISLDQCISRPIPISAPIKGSARKKKHEHIRLEDEAE